RRQEGEIDTCQLKFPQLCHQVFDERGKFSGFDEVTQFVQIDAVDDERWITALRFPRSENLDDRLVVIDRRFRSDPAYDAESFQRFGFAIELAAAICYPFAPRRRRPLT